MSKNIRLNETDYENVSRVKLPTTDGGEAEFRDVDDVAETDNPVYETKNGVMYQKNTVLQTTAAACLESGFGFCGASEMETFEAPNNTSALSVTYCFAECAKLKRVILPKIKGEIKSYMCFRKNEDQVGGQSLEEIQLGSVGYPIASFQYDLGSGIGQLTPTVTIYVADETELPLTKHPFGFTNGTIVYRSSVSGEIREYTTGG
jgi:hypothetical protein